MAQFVGIDLGTTNSAVATYDGENVKLYKSPEQSDVTPSALYIDKRSKYYGRRAYDMAARSPDNVAMNFKRLMGTSTPIKLPAMSIVMTPEECSSEILKILFSYLPDDIRRDENSGTVITVPAAFNQMQRDATLSAAELSGIGQVALMQEPIAAVMSVMRARNSDGIFLIYDLGGGTFDIALAESISRRVSLLEHGGIVMCGGRDFDRTIVDTIVKPWLLDNFDLPVNFSSNSKFSKLLRLATFASEKAKIELSMRTESQILLNEDEVRLKDNSGKEIYFDVPISQKDYDPLIKPKIMETINATREVLERANLSPDDIGRIVFIGGPTNYKPTCDLVSFELGISPDTQVNPMTAVAEGAAVFAEAIDWSSEKRNRKKSRGSVSAGTELDLSFEYTSRTSDFKAQIAVRSRTQKLTGLTFQIDSDIGWSSGRIDLKDGLVITLNLAKNGDNRFKIFVFDANGAPVNIGTNIVTVTRTSATVDAIPASHSIGVEVKESLNSSGTKLIYLARKGDSLPIKASKTFKSGESIRAKGSGAINIKLWEGEIENPIEDNEFIGCLKITGEDFDTGVIEPGADIICEYEVSDSGRVSLSVSVPSVHGTFTRNDFYSRQEGAIDFSKAGYIVTRESETLVERVDNIADKVSDERLNIAKNKLNDNIDMAQEEQDPETVKQAMQNNLEVKRILSKVRKDHLPNIRQMDLENVKEFFDKFVKEYAKPSEITSYESMEKTAKKHIDAPSSEFESILQHMRRMNFDILWRQDWFVVEKFKALSGEEYLFSDQVLFAKLVQAGTEAVKRDDMGELRKIVGMMYSIRIPRQLEEDLNLQANILS